MRKEAAGRAGERTPHRIRGGSAPEQTTAWVYAPQGRSGRSVAYRASRDLRTILYFFLAI